MQVKRLLCGFKNYVPMCLNKTKSKKACQIEETLSKKQL